MKKIFYDPFKNIREAEIDYYQKKVLEDLAVGKIKIVANNKKQYKEKIKIMKFVKKWGNEVKSDTELKSPMG